MQKLNPYFLSIIFLFVFSVEGLSSDFHRGLAAAKNGDFLTALKEWEPLAEAGDHVVQFNLGQVYSKGGPGVPKSHKIAAEWFRLAAESGHAGAQHNLGWMYDNGYGVPRDFKTAVKWFTLAAEQGDAEAQFNLAHHLALGNGVKIDYVYAHMWATFSSARGSKDGEELRGYLEKLLNPAQMQKAKKLSDECIRKKYKRC